MVYSPTPPGTSPESATGKGDQRATWLPPICSGNSSPTRVRSTSIWPTGRCTRRRAPPDENVATSKFLQAPGTSSGRFHIMLITTLQTLQARFAAACAQARDERELDAVRVAYLGRNGEVTTVRRSIGQLAADERPAAGKTINDAVERMEAVLREALDALAARRFDEELR